MFSMRNLLSASLLLAPGLAAPAFAAENLPYPHILSSGENTTVDYGPQGCHHNVVGGGPMRLDMRSDNETRVIYLDNRYAQSRDKNHPLLATLGQGKDAKDVWVTPAEAAAMTKSEQPRG